MSLSEATVSFLGLVVGYLVVSALMNRNKKEAPPDLSPTTGTGVDLAVTLSNWFRILGVRESASREDITAAYRRLLSQYQPAKVAQLDAGIRAAAEARSRQINAAYEMGMRLFK
ncbi:MAG TPA: J domain-containing protein [Steroidobacteraceae bacterium]